ncbi:MAG: hypothetical protein ABI746_04080 [Dermatophilaceae bacterium]
MGSPPPSDEAIRFMAARLRALTPDLGDDRAQRAVRQALDAIAAALPAQSCAPGGPPR